MASIEISVLRLPHGEGLELPRPASAGSAGADIRAAVAGPLVIDPSTRALVPTGLCLEIPPGWEVQVRPRSGLALKHGITVLNSPGTIDSDYRGEVGILLVNLGEQPFLVQRGERIAQLVLAPVTQGQFRERESLSDSLRGAGGFGSSGVG